MRLVTPPARSDRAVRGRAAGSAPARPAPAVPPPAPADARAGIDSGADAHMFRALPGHSAGFIRTPDGKVSVLSMSQGDALRRELTHGKRPKPWRFAWLDFCESSHESRCIRGPTSQSRERQSDMRHTENIYSILQQDKQLCEDSTGRDTFRSATNTRGGLIIQQRVLQSRSQYVFSNTTDQNTSLSRSAASLQVSTTLRSLRCT
jgi:hypothetical protein